jgi:hypothetical protein
MNSSRINVELSPRTKGVLPSGSMPLARKEVLGWALLALSIVSLNVTRYGTPIVSDDSFQYMSIAENLAQGNGIRTSIVHFDQERSHGELPAPVTWFPAGYPALIALVMLAGVSAPWAGFLVSGASLGVLIPITLWLCNRYGLSALASRLTILCLIANRITITFGSAVTTESLFTALSIGSLAMLVAASSERRKTRPGRGLGLWALCGLTIGLCCWVRYAGLFLFTSAALYLALDVVLSRRRDLRGPGLALAAAALPVAILLGRNLYLVGNWRGGNSKQILRSGLEVGKKFVAAAYELFLGAPRLDRLGVAEFLFVLAGTLCAFLVFRSLLRHRESVIRAIKDRPGLLPVVTYLTVYMGMMLIVSFSSPPAFGPRLCYPLLPLVLVLAGLLVTLAAPDVGHSQNERVMIASVLSVVAGYVFLNVRDTVQPSFSNSIFLDRRIAEYLEAPTPSGESLTTWVQSNIPADANIVATFGQATGHALQRKTVSLVGSQYSNQQWDEPHVRNIMLRFHATFLILYPDEPSHPAPDVQKESPFLASLARGEEPAVWLRLVAHNPHIMVFQRIEAAQNRSSPGLTQR